MGYAVAQANTSEPLRFLMVLSSDHITGATGVTPTVTIAKNTGTFAAPMGAVTEIGVGWYQIAPNATDSNTLGPLLIHAEGTGCDPTDDIFDVVSYNPTAFAPVTTPAGPDAVRAIDLINDAFELVGVLDQGETLASADAQKGWRFLNQIVGQLSLMPLTKTAQARDVVVMTSGKGSPTNPYTVGIGGDIDIVRPVAIEAINLLVTTTSPNFEIPMDELTNEAYNALVIKVLTSPYPTQWSYEASFASGMGALYLYPVPTVANSLALYTEASLVLFASLTAQYDLPPGAAPMLTYRLAKRLHRPYGRDWTGALESDLNENDAIFQRANSKMADLGFEAGLVGVHTRPYNIESDT